MLNLKQLREAKGVSQATVARELNISRQTYNNYELGKREADYETLLKLAEYFGTSVDCLISNRINDNISSDDKIKNPVETDQDLILLNRNAKKLPPENRKLLIDMAKAMLKEEFDEN